MTRLEQLQQQRTRLATERDSVDDRVAQTQEYLASLQATRGVLDGAIEELDAEIEGLQ